jgi:hypothetical protein
MVFFLLLSPATSSMDWDRFRESYHQMKGQDTLSDIFKSVNLIKMLNLFKLIKIFNLITFLGQWGSPWPWADGAGLYGVTWHYP